MKNHLIFFTLFLIGFQTYAQKNNRNAALSDFQAAQGLLSNPSTQNEGEAKLMDAKKWIDLAQENDETSSDFKTLKAMGDIYFELNQLWAKKDSDQTHVAGQKSKEGYFRAKKSTSKSKELDEIDGQLRNLQINCYNQGVQKFNKGLEVQANLLLVLSMEIMEERGEIDGQQVYLTGMSYDMIRDYKKAYECYRKAADMDYGDAKLYSAMLNSASLSENDEWINRTIAEGKKKYPKDQDFIITIANVSLMKKDYAQAEEALQLAIQADPMNASMIYVLGNVYEQLGITDRAVQTYKSALNIEPDMFDANYSLGAIYFNEANKIQQEMNMLDLGDPKEDKLSREHTELLNQSETYLANAYNSNPNDYNTVSALAAIYAQLDQMEKYTRMKASLDRIKNGN